MKLHEMDWALIVVIAGAGCAAIYVAVARALRRAVSEQQREMERQLHAMAATVKALQARVAELGRLEEAREGEVAAISASGDGGRAKAGRDQTGNCSRAHRGGDSVSRQEGESALGAAAARCAGWRWRVGTAGTRERADLAQPAVNTMSAVRGFGEREQHVEASDHDRWKSLRSRRRASGGRGEPRNAKSGAAEPFALPGGAQFGGRTPAEPRRLWSADGKACQSPVMGLAIKVNVEPGQAVEAGELILVLEAMKMETLVTAPHSGTVKAVHVKAGDSVKLNQVLVEFE